MQSPDRFWLRSPPVPLPVGESLPTHPKLHLHHFNHEHAVVMSHSMVLIVAFKGWTGRHLWNVLCFCEIIEGVCVCYFSQNNLFPCKADWAVELFFVLEFDLLAINKL